MSPHHDVCEISLITPMFNETEVIQRNLCQILQTLESLGVSWEYILVDDGSKDGSLKKAQEIIGGHPSCRIIHYDLNRGRGFALRQGFAAAGGNYIITTESDLSWGPGIIGEMYLSLKNSKSDMVIASVNLPGGGLENVPIFRSVLSKCGNWAMRRAFGQKLTMVSGMTRAYRREVIESLYLEENGKEIHLEIVMKAQALGYKIVEVPAIIKWENSSSGTKRRIGWSIMRSIMPHIITSLHAGSVKLLVWVALFFGVAGLVVTSLGVVNKFFPGFLHPMPYLVTYGMLLLVLALMFGLFGIISIQLNFIYRSVTHIQSGLKRNSREAKSSIS